MAMTDALPASSSASLSKSVNRWLRAALIAAAAWELTDALTSFGLLFADVDMTEIFGSIGGRILQATVAVRPFAALAVIILAALNRLPWAIMAMAAVVLITWLSAMPGFVLNRPDFDGVMTTLQTLFQIVACPLLAVMAIALAGRRRNLPLATALVCLPTVVSLIGLAAFAISVAIYGF